MSRLRRKLLNGLKYLDQQDKLKILQSNSRLLRKKVLASWKPINTKGPELLQVLTDAMTYNSGIRINYRNSGWRSILPYGWNTSKDGNTLLMCYKDSGEIRSYRLDRIFDVLINDDLNINRDESLSWEDFQMPTLPNIDEIIQETEAEVDEPLPYDTALKALTTNQIDESSESEEENIYQDGEDLSEIDNLDTNESYSKNDNSIKHSDSSEESDTSSESGELGDESSDTDNVTDNDTSNESDTTNNSSSDSGMSMDSVDDFDMNDISEDTNKEE